jgi:cyclase
MSSSRHDHPELGPPQLIEVGDGVFACSTERRTRAYLDRIASVSPAPVTMLVNTHHHGDHTYGNSLFSGATIIGHENCRAALIATGPPGNTGIWDPVDWGDVTLAPPTLTFTQRVRLWSDDRPLEVSYVNGGTPFLLMGSVRGAIDVLTSVVALIPAATIVAGHGAPCDHRLIGIVVGYLEFVLATAAKGIDAGLSPLDLARQVDLGEYAEWLDSERIVGNLHRAYADLGAAKPDVDAVAALRDMVEYNHGQPLSCFA